MLTLKLISEETERVVKGLEKKHFPNAREAVEKVLEYDKIRREAQQKLDNNKQQANQFAKQIGALMKEGKKEEAESAKAQVAMLKADAKALEEIMEKAQNDMTNQLLEIPNIPCEQVPEGKDAADNVVVKEGGEKPNLGEDALCHWDLLKKYNLVDFDLGVKITGASIPYGDTTARNGHWEKGPGYDLFKTVEESLGKLNVIAEDLGYLTDTVKQMVADCGYPGMKVFEFAFDSRDSSGTSNYLPHNYTENSVVYTGTHDNETMIGWLKNILPEERQMLKDYLHYDGEDDAVLVDMSIDCIMASVSDKCIVPMQDYLKLDNTARMNKPNTLGNNWMWRLDKNAFSDSLKERMRDITVKTNRI